MRILGIDTSGYANAIGVVDSERVLADITFEAKADSLAKIITNIDFTLNSVGLTLNDIDSFGIGLGPGSWTGIRIGVTVGKILAYSRKKPAVGVSTLAALAYNARNVPSLICPIISAGTKDVVYAAFYRTQNGTIGKVNEYYIGDIPGLSQVIKEPVVLVGSRIQDYAGIINQTPGFIGTIIKTIEDTPRGSAVALLAMTQLKRGESDDILALAPLYLKESTAKAFRGRYLTHSKSR